VQLVNDTVISVVPYQPHSSMLAVGLGVVISSAAYRRQVKSMERQLHGRVSN